MPDGTPEIAFAPAPAEPPRDENGGTDSRPDLRRPIFGGLAVTVVFFGGFLGWAGSAPLESAAIAPGVVSLDSNRKTIQHLEGGIVSEIRVREGETVARGQALIRLDQIQARARLDFLGAQMTAEDHQIALVAEEVALVSKLFAKGLTQKPRLLALQRRKAELEGSLARHRAQLRAAKDVLARTVIRAPMAGTIVGLQVHTPGGVIAKGEALLYIVPRDEPLIIEARVDPNDIDVVYEGLAAQIRLTSFSTRTIKPLDGRVVSVSADSIADRRSGESYYLARIEIEGNPTETLKGGQLYPGMPAEVIIVTGARTALDYFLAPLVRSFNRAFRES